MGTHFNVTLMMEGEYKPLGLSKRGLLMILVKIQSEAITQIMAIQHMIATYMNSGLGAFINPSRHTSPMTAMETNVC